MRSLGLKAIIAIPLFSGAALAASLTPEQLAQLPAPATHTINFSSEIKPIFEASCIKCHGRGREKGGFRIDHRETLLKGGDSGPAIVPGNSADSLLVSLVQGIDPDSVMPKKGTRLTPEQIGILRAWIDQGAPWDTAVTFGRLEPLNLKPRLPSVPAGPKSANPIDRFLAPYFTVHKITPAKPVSDRLFARRAWLDIIGLLPPPEQLDKFLADKHPDKRTRLVDQLLSDDRNYAEHWLTFWNDLLRNDYKGTGYIDGGRKQITPWLYSALLTNMPYDKFVARLVNPSLESEGFTKGIVWRGVVNASQTPQMQAAQNISQVFMGVNLKCASCHDSFVNDFTLADAYGLAGIYADGPLEMVHCDKPTGKKADLKFIYPELGDIDPKADKTNRLAQLAHLLTNQKDGRLTRTFVNRLWQRFFGRGLVEPVDDMEKPAWKPDLLDWLAEDFAAHNYDVRFLIKRILTSRAYQMPAVDSGEQGDKEFVFRGPFVRRMDAEQFRDALFTVTGVGGNLPGAKYEFLPTYMAARANIVPPARLPLAARWIWNDPKAAARVKPGTLYFRREIVLSKAPLEAAAIIACDDSFTLYVNGERVESGDNVSRPRVFDLASRLQVGRNLLAISAENKEPEKSKDTNAPPKDPNTAAGLFVMGFVRERDHKDLSSGTTNFYSDFSWLCSDKHKDHWEKPNFQTKGWSHPFELGRADMAPWNIGKQLSVCLGVVSQYGLYRASIVDCDFLTRALGRPNREQVVTTRSSAATTLQGVEITNGSELAHLVEQGAEDLMAEESFVSSRRLIQRFYRRGLGRPPTSEELGLARTFVTDQVKKEGVEDLVWALANLPEFQLIY
jgi:mono/diheme cytochrome c family protein